MTLQNRKFSEFIDIDDKELLPDSIDNDSIYLSGYVEGDENNQNIKIKVSQLAEKVATDTSLVNNISTEVVKTEKIVNLIDEKVKEEVDTFIKGSGEEEPSEIVQIIDKTITDRTASFVTNTDIENFVSKDDYATEENAGLVKLAPATTTFLLRTALADNTEEEIPSVYTADDIDNKLNDLKIDINGTISDSIADKVSFDGFNPVKKDVEKLSSLKIEETFDEHRRLIQTNTNEIEKINTEIGEPNTINEGSIWTSIDNLTSALTEKTDNTIYENFVNETFEDFKKLSDDKHKDLKDEITKLEKKCEDERASLETTLTNDIKIVDAKLGNPQPGELIGNAWNKIYGLSGDIEGLRNRLFGVEDSIRRVEGIANGAFSITTNFDRDIKLLREKVDDIDSNYITIDALDSKNFANENFVNSNIQIASNEIKNYTDDEVSKLEEQIGGNTRDIISLTSSLDSLNSTTIPAITINADRAFEIANESKSVADTAEAVANSFDEKISSLKIETDKIAAIEQKNTEQDREIETAKNNAQDAINVANGLEERIIDLDNDINGESGIKVTLVAYENRISNIEELVGTGPIDISSISHIHRLDENATVVAHINNINNEVDALREDVDDHHKLISSHSTRLDELTEAIGGYNDGEEKRPCTSGQQFNQKYEIGEWPNNFSEIKDLWSGLYSVAKIVGFDHQDLLLPNPDERSVITELADKSDQIQQNSAHITELEEKINAFNIAIDTAELYTPGMVSIIDSADDGDGDGSTLVADRDITAVSIDYFENHKPLPFLQDEDETQLYKKGTVYVEYKNVNDGDEQPLVYSKAAIDSKLNEEYTKKDSGLNYNDDGLTFSLGNNGRDDLPESIEGVAIPNNCPAMCVTKRGIYITVFYGDAGVEQPQGNSRGWRWVQLGTVPQEFVASETRN